MVVDESTERSLHLRLTLERLGYEVVAEVSNPRELYDAAARAFGIASFVDFVNQKSQPIQRTNTSTPMARPNQPHFQFISAYFAR